ncbi:hypothetical protein NOR_04368 [Metarhizium rileyi]|uniref:Uncharacterized protein n=1 Tax=Metarhizium rileyi (strain RCEF 4871) TaxID=1649241 RepID=A0A162JLL9_METRR|nr:hypothetical protein NOR_04368 [Metarhizium rileyi RCEF 4871]
MEAAAKTVDVLSRRILPEKPHHLAASPTWRYRPPPDDDTASDSRRPKRRFEEWHNNRLQYLTLLSEADRGTLFTRPYYDMREEPVKPVPRDVSTLAKGPGTGEKKKLSLSDYKNKKTGLVASASPPEPAITKRKESERAAAGPLPTIADGPRPAHQEPLRRVDGPKLREPESTSATAPKPRPNRDHVITDTRLPPKPPSLPPRPPSPAGKRRMPDADDDRPQKRPRPDDRSQPNREEAQRRKEKPPSTLRDRERDREKDRDRDKARDRGSSAPNLRDDRARPSSSLLNGKPLLKSTVNSGQSVSPASRPRGDSLNGARGSNTNRTSPTKPDTAIKAYVPPLLSPLHLGFEGKQEKRQRGGGGGGGDDDDPSPKKERKRHDIPSEAAAPSKPKKTDIRKPKPAIAIPPLLSPTLPPAVEAELKRQKKVSSDSSDERSRDNRDAFGLVKRGDGDGRKPTKKLGHRRRLIVVLSVPESLRASFIDIVGRAPSQGKNSQSHSERENERARDKTDQQTPARKRPVGAGAGAGSSDGVAMKRPRSSDVPPHSKLATPATPSKKPTAMSRVSSTNSVAQTPTEAVNSTPLASASADRRPNGSDVPLKATSAEAKAINEKAERLRETAKKLKHEADQRMKKYRGDTGSMRGKPGEFDVKSGFVLSLESIIMFMMAFYGADLWRGMDHKVGDHRAWQSLLPLIEFLKNEMRRCDVTNSQPLYAMVLMLHAVSLEELLRCYARFDHVTELFGKEIVGRLREKNKIWPRFHDVASTIQNPRLRVDVHPWSTLDHIVDASLRILRIWCAEEKVEWAPTQSLKDIWPLPSNTSRR